MRSLNTQEFLQFISIFGWGKTFKVVARNVISLSLTIYGVFSLLVDFILITSMSSVIFYATYRNISFFFLPLKCQRIISSRFSSFQQRKEISYSEQLFTGQFYLIKSLNIMSFLKIKMVKNLNSNICTYAVTEVQCIHRYTHT